MRRLPVMGSTGRTRIAAKVLRGLISATAVCLVAGVSNMAQGDEHSPKAPAPQADQPAMQAATLPAAAQPADAVRDADATRQAIRDKVRQGKMNTCITDAVDTARDDQVIILQNHCEKQVNVMLCVRVEGGSKSYFLLLIDSLSKARQRLMTQGQPKFNYRYNSCSGPYCSPPESEC